MKLVLRFSLLFALGAFLPVLCAADDFTVNVPKGQKLVIKIPHNLWVRDKLDAASGQPIYIVEIDSAFMSARKWETGNIPSLREFVVEKSEECGRMRYDCKLKGYRQVELRSPAVWVKLRFAPDVTDVNSSFREVISLGTVGEFEESDYFKTKVFGAASTRIFSGPLAALPDDTKLRLFKDSLNTGAEDLTSETFKGKLYLVVNMGQGDDVYNSTRLNQSARTAKVVNEKLLNLLKKFGTSLPAQGELFGLKLMEAIPFKDFVRGGAAQYDKLQIYAPSESIRKFSDADITNQQFIDGCTVLVDDNRVQVNLSSS
jgi:hypothetical protein